MRKNVGSVENSIINSKEPGGQKMGVTISGAIEILKDYRDGVEMEELREYPIVLSLAIEALERLKRGRQRIELVTSGLLPGETKE